MHAISFRVRLCILCLIALTAAVITATALSPALGTGPEGITSFSGSTVGAVAYSTNSSTGTAVEGVTGTVAGGKALWGVANNTLNAGTGVRATAFGPSSFGLYAEATNTNKAKPSYGLYATSKSSYAVYAFTNVPGLTSLLAYNSDVTSNGSHAIRAQSRGDAITGVSTGNNGVVGQVSATPTPVATAYFALAGVLGRDTTASFYNAGVAGTSTNGVGVLGISSTGVEGVATSGNGNGVLGFAQSGRAVWGYTFSGVGVSAFAGSSGTALFAETNNNSSPSLTVEGGTGGFGPSSSVALVNVRLDGDISACGGGATHDVFSIDQKGDVIACGTVTGSGSPLAIRRAATGRHVVSYSAQQTLPTIEDFGQGRLVGGQAYVALDPTFASTVDPRAPYLVFLTPRGDTNGLYVAQATPAGFSVRENRGGRSTVAFDYRIVAKPYDTNAPRLPLESSLPHPRAVTLPLPRNQTRPQFRFGRR